MLRICLRGIVFYAHYFTHSRYCRLTTARACGIIYSKERLFVYSGGDVMKRVSLDEFYSKFCDGYEFIYKICNQSDKNNGRYVYVSEDRRVFNQILVAHYPNCVRFYDDNNNIMQIECVNRIEIRNSNDKTGMFFVDLFCRVTECDEGVFTFVVKSK